jgi:hypothetical protein
MTAPGDPLIAGHGGTKYQIALASYSDFPNLHAQVEAAMVRRSNSDTELLWTKKMRGQVARGYISTIESSNVDGKTGTFQVHYVAVNDKRNPTQLTYGIFDEKDKEAIIQNFGGERHKGGRP